MKPKSLEKIIAHSFVSFLALKNALHENIRVDNSNDATLHIHQGKRQKFVEHEKFAGFKNGRFRWQGDHARHHYFPQWSRRRRREQTPGGNNTNEAFALIAHVKINDTLTNPFAPDSL